jgi:dTDP-4-amino-4,6-dideoxy-D-glucose transaminase
MSADDHGLTASILRPALLGGAPLFGPPGLGTAQLAAPDPTEWMDLRRRIARGEGPRLVLELEERLACLHEVPEVVALSNASYALALVARLLSRGRVGMLAMPSYSFRGLPYIGLPWGQRPCFVEISSQGGVLDAEALDLALSTQPIAAVLAVHNVHWRCDVEALASVTNRHQVPLFYDAVYAQFATTSGRPSGSDGEAEVFSLHATKLLNGFEGGYVTTQSRALADELRRLRAGGPCSRGEVLGIECGLAPAHAAMALASLSGVDETIAANRRSHNAWSSALDGLQGAELVEYQPNERHTWASALVSVAPDAPISRDRILALLQAERVLARPYYSPPLHKAALWRAESRGPLSVTEEVEDRVLQLPLGGHVSLEDIARIGALLHGWFALARKGALPC